MSDDAQALSVQLQQTQQRLQGLERHLVQLEQAMNEIQVAMATLEGIDGELAGLVPVGAGVRIRAKVDGSQPVMMDIGGGYSVETDVAGAKTKLQARAESTEAALRASTAEADRLAAHFQTLQGQLATMSPPSS